MNKINYDKLLKQIIKLTRFLVLIGEIDVFDSGFRRIMGLSISGMCSGAWDMVCRFCAAGKPKSSPKYRVPPKAKND